MNVNNYVTYPRDMITCCWSGDMSRAHFGNTQHVAVTSVDEDDSVAHCDASFWM